MHLNGAQLRHRQLTQELYDVGDEVAEYLDHLAEAVADWDAELVEDCFAELEGIAAEAVQDTRGILAELTGLRRALLSGPRGPLVAVPVRRREPVAEPSRPSAAPSGELCQFSGALDAYTVDVERYFRELAEFVVDRTDCLAADLNPRHDPFSPAMSYARAAAQEWLLGVAQAFPAHTRTRRGSAPPTFLAERARIDAVVSRVAARRASTKGAAS